jgi:hypothetical protein
MEGGTGQVDAMPACGRLVNHAFLYIVHAAPGCWIWSGLGNTFSTVGEACKTFVGNAGALIQPIRASVAEAAVNHVPTVQARSSSKCVIPDKWVETSYSPIMINQGEKLLGQLYLFSREGWRRTIRGGT